MATQSVHADQVQILTSIKPLQLIAEQMLGDLAEVDVLMPPGSSPHHFSLKPSAIRKMHEADLFIWGGEDLELFLRKPVSQLDTPALAVLSEGEEHDEHESHEEHEEHADHDEHEAHAEHKEHDEHAHHDDHAEHKEHDEHAHHDDHEEHEEHDEHGHHEHNHDGDPHFWMAPETALAAADKIRDRLVESYPDHAEEFTAAYNRFAGELEVSDKQIRQSLSAVQGKGFFVFHDAFGSFVEHYGLNQLGYFTVDPGRKPGAKRLAEIRSALEQKQATCVFIEPQFKAPVVESITRGLNIGVGRLDPLASDSPVDSLGYTRYMQSLADSFTQCLSAK